MEKISKLLKELTSAVGVSGDEKNIVNLLKKKLEAYGEVKTDCMNNVYCTFGEGKHFLLDAHLDEIGMIVTDITSDGFLKVSQCGTLDCRMLLGYEVSVWGAKELKGVISTLPPHLQKDGDSKKVPSFSDVSVDVGMKHDEIVKYVSLGDRVTFKRNFTPLLNDCVSASCLDDRAGVAAILLALDRLKKLSCKITVLFSSQEEVGLRGGKIGAFGEAVDEAICVDVSFAHTPSCDKADCGEMGKGAMIGFSPILDGSMSKKLVDIAKRRDIAYQCEIMSATTGTNADVISVNETGVKTALISIPEKYMHQPVEVVKISDIVSVSNLIYEYIGESAGDCNA